MTLSFNVPTFPKSGQATKSGFLADGKSVYGTGMPSVQGWVSFVALSLSTPSHSLRSLSPSLCRLRRALEKMDAGPNGSRKVFWTSLRE